MRVGEKVDLAMWNLNGERVLPTTLRRINRVIPPSAVGQRIFVDGGSKDRSVEIAEELGWVVYKQRRKGLCGAMNDALDLVKTSLFISFENDLILSPNWWVEVPPLLKHSSVAVASGVRFASQPHYIRRLQEYTMERYRRWQGRERARLTAGVVFPDTLPMYLRTKHRTESAYMWGKTFDNTIYDTEVLREVGGFPTLSSQGGMDPILTYRLREAGYEWLTAYSVQSIHVREGLQQELKQQRFYGACTEPMLEHLPKAILGLRGRVFRLLYSPLAALHIVFKMRSPEILFVYPLIRFSAFRGIFDYRKGLHKHPAEIRGDENKGTR